MKNDTHALDYVRTLLGHGATDDATWQDMHCFERAALLILNQVWGLETFDSTAYWQIIHPNNEVAQEQHNQRVIEAVARMWAELGGATSRYAAAFFLHPQLWRPRYANNRYGHEHYYRAQTQNHLLNLLAEACIEQPPADWAAQVCRRLLTVCSAANTAGSPDVVDCVGYLLNCDMAQVGPLLDALAVGEWESAWWNAVALSDRSYPFAIDRLREHWQRDGARHAVALLYRLYKTERLDIATFRQLLEATPQALEQINSGVVWYVKHPPTEQRHVDFATELQRLTDAVLWDMLCDFRPETLPTLQQISRLSGGRYVLRLAEEVERHGLSRLAGGNYQSLAYTLVHLFGVLQRRSDDNNAALVALLKNISVGALLAALPHARHYEAELCAALDYRGAAEFVALLHRLGEGNPARSTDPLVGVLHRADVLNIVEVMDEAHVRTLLDTFEPHHGAATTLIKAALGWNRKDIRRLLGRRNQLAARAFALLPLEKPDDVLQRFLMLTRYEREANASGAGKKAFERAAAQAGLANLAFHAGYTNPIRLEWAMQDQLGAETIALGRQWEIEGYTLMLVLREGVPALDIRNTKRALKRIPAAVSRDYAYREVRATLEQAQDQERRLRRVFLDAMRRAHSLTYDELALLRRNPLATSLLERLVLLDAAGACGLFRADDLSMEGAHGERVRITGAVQIAHPYTLAQAGLLNDWQTEIVRRQVVQPFKQVFRELYIITPAEQEAVYASARLAGRRMRGRQATAVLAQMGWLLDDGDVSKPFHDLGLTARFESGSYYYYGEDSDGATTGALAFYPLVARHTPDGERRIKLADVPPLIFSEVLRDLDLVTVIAHQSEEHGTSREVLQGRGALVRATVAALGLAQVSIEGAHVHVRGHRASYRIHLATGAIYLASGQYLCIVPSHKDRKAIYLPFAEGGDAITSEIISKILLLANDRHIDDPTILRQIAPVSAAA